MQFVLPFNDNNTKKNIENIYDLFYYKQHNLIALYTINKDENKFLSNKG